MFRYIKNFSKIFHSSGMISISKSFCSSTENPRPQHYFETIKELDPNYARRLDKYVQKKYNLQWEVVQTLVRKKLIKVLCYKDHTLIKDPSYQLSPGDIIYLPRSFGKGSQENQIDPRTELAKIANAKVDKECCDLFKMMILYEDKQFLAVNKLPGISSQGGNQVKLNMYYLFNNYINWKMHELNEAYAYTPGIVHRLDKGTSGLMILAKDKGFASKFSTLLHSRSNIEKTYIGVVEGIPASVSSIFRLRIEGIELKGKNKEKSPKEKDQKTGFEERKIETSEGDLEKKSVTYYEIIGIVKIQTESDGSVQTSYLLNPNIFPEEEITKEKKEEFLEISLNKVIFHTIVKFQIEGGRKHQIRKHSSGVLLAPILNDKKFNIGSPSERIVEGLLDDWDSKELNESDEMWIDGERIETVKDKKREEVYKKHFDSVIKNNELIFLHSRNLEFEMKEKRYKLRAGFPAHFLIYFEYIFGENTQKFISKL